MDHKIQPLTDEQRDAIAEHLGLAYRVADRLCANRREYAWSRADTHQEAFLALVRAMQTYNPEMGTPLKAFLRKSIRLRLMIKYQRWMRRNGGHVEKAHQIPDRTPEPEFREVLKFENMTRFLDPRSAAIVELYYREGLSGSEIGERFGVSNKRIYQILRAAIVRIRRRLNVKVG